MNAARLTMAAVSSVLILSSANAAGGAYLEGRFDLNFEDSSWEHEPHMTDAFWVFQHDDGKTRTGYNVQHATNGRLLVYYYDNIS